MGCKLVLCELPQSNPNLDERSRAMDVAQMRELWVEGPARAIKGALLLGDANEVGCIPVLRL